MQENFGTALLRLLNLDFKVTITYFLSGFESDHLVSYPLERKPGFQG